MAAPNLIGATTITGKTTGTVLTSTSAFSVINNPASSGKCLKVNTLNVANYGASPANVSVSYYTQADVGGTALALLSNAVIPAGTTMTVIDRSTQYYLQEDTSIGATAATGNTFVVTVSYEDIS